MCGAGLVDRSVAAPPVVHHLGPGHLLYPAAGGLQAFSTDAGSPGDLEKSTVLCVT